MLYILLANSAVLAQTETPVPKPAIDVIDHAVHQARKTHKPILVMFQSSLSDLCKQIDSTLSLTAVKNIFEKYFIVTRIRVQEQAGVIDSLANPGGMVMMKAFAGGQPQLPFCVFFNKKGRKVADTNVPEQVPAASQPVTASHLDALLNVVKKCAPHISPEQWRSLKHYFHQ